MFSPAASRQVVQLAIASIVFIAFGLASSQPGAQVPPRKLSDWLLEQPRSPDAYPLGLSWRVPSEVASQEVLRRELMYSLSGLDGSVSADPRAAGRLRDWLRTLPVTGRVPVAVADARWLQANPARNPVIQPSHTVILPSRPQAVVVVTGLGDLCPVMHSPGREAIAYLEACDARAAARADWAWIAQPDGRVQRFGVAGWNREAQDEPAPGAWIWGPARDSGWPEKMSERLIRFLATQGPAEFSDRAATPAPQSPVQKSTGLQITSNDWGGAGLLQTPSARIAPAGTLTLSASRVSPYTWLNLMVSPFDWMEAGYRYMDISNRPYVADPTGKQSLKDKSFDAKFRLLPESAHLPQIAVGFRDMAGTGLFSGEYVVANKRTGAFDWSLGIAWGYGGARGDFKGFGTRKAQSSEGGTFAFSSYFRGPAAVIGGVQYQAPGDKLILKLELDGNNYQHEPVNNNQRQSSPLNVGLVYRAWENVDLSVGLERGNTLMFGVALHGRLDRLSMPKLSDPPRLPIAASRPAHSPDWQTVSEEITRQAGWQVEWIRRRGNELRVTFANPRAGYWIEHVDRVAAVLHRDAPATVDRFAFVYREGGIDVAEHVVDRATWVANHIQTLPPSERRQAVIARAAAPLLSDTETLYHNKGRPRFDAGFGIDYFQNVGGPNAFVLYQVSAAERFTLRLRDDTWLDGKVRLGLIDNFDKFTFTAPSNLPRVRTFLREFVTTSKLTMPNLQLNHSGKISDNHYYLLYGGYLEEMFGGVGGEWMYRPFASRTALGIDVNAVKQRNFHQNLAFRDYTTVTGHATLYWDTGWQDVIAKLSAGRYLAKDSGVTVDLSRTFHNGVSVGAFFTKTTASAAEFGEGSFDKGVYVNIPFDAMLAKSTAGVANFTFRPLTRDGGAKLWRATTLYDLTNARDERTLGTKPAPQPNEALPPEDRRETWAPAPALPAPQLALETRAGPARWAKDDTFEFRLTQALYGQQFRNVEVEFDNAHRLNLRLANDTIRPMSRAIGRAARTAARMAPVDTRGIRITFMDDIEPLVTYDFIDAVRLERFYNGEIGLAELTGTVAIEVHAPGAREKDPLALLGDLETEAEPRTLGSLVAKPRVVDRVVDDFSAAIRTAGKVDWLRAVGVGGALVLGSSWLDQHAYKFAKNHADNSAFKAVENVGNAIPWLGLGAAALAAWDKEDPRRSRTGFAATEAGATALLLTTALKPVIGRARPETGNGRASFKPLTVDDRYNSFPSRHTAVAWAVATPFALEYDANWLYAVAAITNVARVGSRQHWYSDTVAGSVIGYGIGRIFWESSRPVNRPGPSLALDRSGIKLAWEW